MSAATLPPVLPIGCGLSPSCTVPARRDRLRQGGQLNGIDFVEVGDDGVTLCVHLFGPIPQGITVANVRVSGGDRITGLRVIAVSEENEPEMHDDACLRVVLDREGDHSPYCLCLVDASSGGDPAGWTAYPAFDPRYACVGLRFRLDCPGDLDCATSTPCVQTPEPPPEINYLAKDYASFRQLFLDRMALDAPTWRERHVPDIGIALVETMAYTADYLSYYQDAVATEAYLATARRRISVRRHARLVDYRMHEGCNARALVVLSVPAGEATLDLAGLSLLVPPPGQPDVTPGVLTADQYAKARAQGALVFEPMSLDGASTITIAAANHAIRLHTWGDELCCLARGSTQAVLVDQPLAAPSTPATPEDGSSPPVVNLTNATNNAATGAATDAPQRVLRLQAGDLLIFEEVLGPATGNLADADPGHRHAVRLTAVQPIVDPLDGSLLLRVSWDPCDALPFDLCLSVRMPSPDCTWLHDVSLARGNVLLVDHGDHPPGRCDCTALCTPPGQGDSAYPGLAAALAAMPDACQRCDALAEDCWLVPGTTEYDCCRCDGAVPDVRRPPTDTGHVLPGTPLTWAEPLPGDANAPVCALLARDPRAALPQLEVYGGALGDILLPGRPDARWRWESRQDLLESGADDRHFVVEVDDEGATHLRFGDGVLGRQPQAGDFFRARMRIGNGAAGNVGRDSIVWLASSRDVLPDGLAARNPIAAGGGQAAETLAEVKLYAPGAFRAHSLRAIVPDDYARFAATDPSVQGAVCTMAWNGSGYEADVMLDPLGREMLAPDLARRVRAGLEPYRRIGHDVAVRSACYVPLRIVLFVCVRPDFLVAHVEAALRERFGAGLRSDGTPGFFHPDRLRLGAAVGVGALMAEAQAVVGVAHVEVRTLQRMDDAPADDVPDDGLLHLTPTELARVDNDPDHPDHGSIAFLMGGGR
ncbi:putative baseplate assembly protein [Dyella lutea]|uniref:Baseplate assembly protein n=1 Tax=Dyella lutea TaxID=2950441 RepID=A0ABT1FCX3_9GAMM|nr:putative baseplate assembly protein [Dyella lutea]MCP1375221.1 putative baseplate assembly protein [Dyella lutea]